CRSSGSRREAPLGDQLPAQLDGVGMIDRQHADRHAADRRQADQLRATPAEVLRPPVAPGIIQSDNFTCYFVETRKIWTLVPVASGTGQGQVAESRLPPVLLGEDVVDVERPRVERQRQP